METPRSHFRLCSSCKKPLPFDSTYYVCSVSTCNQKRTGLTFCSLPCFEAHVPGARHREAWAEERRAPTREAWEREQAEAASSDASSTAERKDERRVVGAPAKAQLQPQGLPRDILIVVSKLKAYVKARSGMSTSDAVADVLSDIVREYCDSAIQKAAADGRKTVMPRDF